MKAPFPYFGGKSLIAPKIWELLGNPAHYLEPFAGSLAVLLARPNQIPVNFAETVNDKDCIIANVWRSLKFDPEQTAYFADDIVCHVDLIAKKKYINEKQPELAKNMSINPDFYDPKQAGFYIWAASCWIGSGLTKPNQIPHISKNGMGINGQIPHIGHAGKGINGQRPHLTKKPQGIIDKPIYEWFIKLSERLRRVRIVNGDWTQILGGDWQGNWNSVGIYFDPPYSAKRDKGIYAHDSFTVAHDVREFIIKLNKRHPEYRLILSGYYEEHLELLDYGFDFISWKTTGGYGNTSQDKTKKSQGQENASKEVIWFSKSCLENRLFPPKNSVA